MPMPMATIPRNRVMWETISGGTPNQKPSVGQTERNVGGLSLTPAGLCKRQLDDPYIGQVHLWVGSGTRSFILEVCTSCVATRHY